jgi:hypothetical protein
MKAIGLELGETLRRHLSELNAARVERDNNAVSVLLLEEDHSFQEQLRDIIREEIILPNGSADTERYRNEVRAAQNHQAKLINALSGRFGVSKLDEISRNAPADQLQPSAPTPPKELPAAATPPAPPNETGSG